MEDDLNIFENGRRPQFFGKRKTTSIFLKMEDNLKKIMQPKTIKSKNNNIFENGRLHKFFFKKEDNLIFGKYKTTSKQ